MKINGKHFNPQTSLLRPSEVARLLDMAPSRAVDLIDNELLPSCMVDGWRVTPAISLVAFAISLTSFNFVSTAPTACPFMGINAFPASAPNNRAGDLDKRLTADAVAEQTGLPRSSVMRLFETGEIPTVWDFGQRVTTNYQYANWLARLAIACLRGVRCETPNHIRIALQLSTEDVKVTRLDDEGPDDYDLITLTEEQ